MSSVTFTKKGNYEVMEEWKKKGENIDVLSLSAL